MAVAHATAIDFCIVMVYYISNVNHAFGHGYGVHSMLGYLKKNWPFLSVCLTGAAIWAVGHASLAHAQSRGYEYTLNGRTITTNPDVMSGPRGCQSNLMNIETREMVCPGDEIATPRSIWAGHIARHCGIDREGESCIGGFVAVGRNCPAVPQGCRIFRIRRPYDTIDQYEVNMLRISQLGDELWIARPGEGYWRLFASCHAGQFTLYPRRNNNC